METETLIKKIDNYLDRAQKEERSVDDYCLDLKCPVCGKTGWGLLGTVRCVWCKSYMIKEG